MLEYDRDERATNIATNATLGALIDVLVVQGVISASDAFNVFSLARKGLSAFASDPDIKVACDKLAAAATGFTEKG